MWFQDRTRKVVIVIAITFFLMTAARAQGPQHDHACIDFVINDVTCEGHRGNFPEKVCQIGSEPITSSTYCDPQAYYSIWLGFCPKHNHNVSQFCEGTGHFGPYPVSKHPCLLFVPCKTDDDCNQHRYDPNVPATHLSHKLLCYECCLFCFDEPECKEFLKSPLSGYTTDADCQPCNPMLEQGQSTESYGNQPDTSGSTSPSTSESANANNNGDENRGTINGGPVPVWMYIVGIAAVVGLTGLLVVLVYRRTSRQCKGKPKQNSLQMLDIVE